MHSPCFGCDRLRLADSFEQRTNRGLILNIKQRTTLANVLADFVQDLVAARGGQRPKG